MNFIELFMLAVGLSMDAFAVAAIIGLGLVSITVKKVLIVGLYFGFFQGIMPLIGYLAASRFAGLITAFSHWVAFVVLAIIGGRMVIGSIKTNKTCLTHTKEASLAPMAMLPLALGTSIDALAVGVPLAFLYVNIIPAVLFIGVMTFTISIVGVRIGSIFGAKLHSKATLAGGIVLVLMGVWILLENLL
ncbi:MAG: manganese efflux pump MntP family protein [Defluviitaleaceae bacterium]|nr:manganese efflux pump MntP family protein [Defluviitaleaceae bacterium]